jgi:malate dehydrogenase
MGVRSDGSYGITEGLIAGMPCTCANGEWSVVPDLRIGDALQPKLEATVAELAEERDAVRDLGLVA